MIECMKKWINAVTFQSIIALVIIIWYTMIMQNIGNIQDTRQGFYESVFPEIDDCLFSPVV